MKKYLIFGMIAIGLWCTLLAQASGSVNDYQETSNLDMEGIEFGVLQADFIDSAAAWKPFKIANSGNSILNIEGFDYDDPDDAFAISFCTTAMNIGEINTTNFSVCPGTYPNMPVGTYEITLTLYYDNGKSVSAKAVYEVVGAEEPENANGEGDEETPIVLPAPAPSSIPHLLPESHNNNFIALGAEPSSTNSDTKNDSFSKYTQARVINVEEYANVRSGPGMQYEIIGNVALGESIKLHQWSSDGVWCQVFFENDTQIAWLNEKFIDIRK